MLTTLAWSFCRLRSSSCLHNAQARGLRELAARAADLAATKEGAMPPMSADRRTKVGGRHPGVRLGDLQLSLSRRQDHRRWIRKKSTRAELSLLKLIEGDTCKMCRADLNSASEPQELLPKLPVGRNTIVLSPSLHTGPRARDHGMVGPPLLHSSLPDSPTSCL